MKKTIHKYQFRIDVPEDGVKLTMPKGARILAIQHQNGADYRFATLWALVSAEETETEVREIQIYRTGGEIERPLITAQATTVQFAPDLVLHFFWNDD